MSAVGGGGKHGPGVPFGTSFTGEGRAAGELWFQRRRVKPLVATPFVSALAGHELGCPRCDVSLVALGDRYGCEQCGGMFVETAALAAMLAEMTGKPWDPPASSGVASARVCSACTKPMTAETLDDVTLDRCADHGYWFDAGELAAALEAAAHPADSLGRRALRWLFDR